MDITFAGYLAAGLFVVLIFLRIPIAYALGGVGLGGLVWIYGLQKALVFGVNATYTNVANFTFTAVPLFLLMGYFAFNAGLTRDAFDAAIIWFGRLPGGLAIATVGACALFAACSGSGAAAAAVMGRMCIPEMLRYRYKNSLAAGVVASAGTLAVLIPPSIIMVIYGVMANTSIAKLLIAGIIPGIMSAFVFAVGIYIRCRLNPELAPLSTEVVTLRDRLVALKKIWGIIVLFLLVIGGIYLGWFTPTEGAAAGASGALILGLVTRRLRMAAFKETLLETAQTSGMIFMIVAGAALFSVFLDITALLKNVTAAIVAMNLSPTGLVFVLSFLYIILGCFLDSVSMMILTLPFLYPVFEAMHIDTVWFGILIVKLVEIGCITPPFGITVYVVKGVVGETMTLAEIFGGAFFFFLLEMINLSLLILFPQISLWLPSMLQ